MLCQMTSISLLTVVSGDARLNSTVASAKTLPSRSAQALLWILRLVVAFVFLSGAVMHLAGTSMAIAEFKQIELGDSLRYFTGIFELGGGVLVLVPVVSGVGAAILLAVDIGALIAQVSVLHMDWVHTIVIGALLLILISKQRDQFLSPKKSW